MAITKRVFEQVAQSLRHRREREANATHQGAGTAAAVATTDAIAKDLAEIFRDQNENFNRDRFLRACGLNVPIKL